MSEEALQTHLASGATTVCRCWSIARKDGVRFGFTDHDLSLTFEGIAFKADTGLTAKALMQTSGLSVDNTEAIGALSAASVTEEDIRAGRYDGADVTAWLVNWADPSERMVQFRGSIGEIRRRGGAFTAELRGISELLNRPQGRVYQKPCSAVLGDSLCGVDLNDPTFRAEVAVEEVEDGRLFRLASLGAYDARWFERGTLVVVTGAASGLRGVIKADRSGTGGREIELWQAIGLVVEPGDVVQLEAGCDKRTETCQQKFNNFLNFRGFPHIPGEDWLMSYPQADGRNDGGSREGSA